MSDLLLLRDALARSARGSLWRDEGGVTFTPSPAGREILERAVAKQRARGRVNYTLADAARDVLDWVARTEAATRR